MLKHLLFAAITSAAMNTSALASGYVSTELQGVILDWNSPDSSVRPNSAGGLALRYGMRSEHFGAELGIEQVSTGYHATTIGSVESHSHFSMNTATLDGFLFCHLAESGWFQPFLTAGLAYTNAKDRVVDRWETQEIIAGSVTPELPEGKLQTIKHKKVTGLFSVSEFEWRAGIGADIRLNQNITTRFAVRYQPYSFGDRLNGGASINIGLLFAL